MRTFSDLYKILLIFVLVTVGMTFLSLCSSATGREGTKAKTIKGIDVSHFSGSVDWQKVKPAGYTFAFAKATEGVDFMDPTFQDHWQEIKKAGLIRGAYHFYVTEDDPELQADFFIKNVSLRPGDLLPALDIESIGKGTKPGLVQRLKKFLGILEKHYGVKPIIYTGPKFWNSHLNDHFGAYPLWIAEYGVNEPVNPKGWKEWHLWQWKENATVPGVEKGADLSIFNHKEKDFSSLLF
ncbi:MAG: glycoside hydrolase family 25 protein [Candidatus Aminicenantes bacterium]|nr:MAG: glycoside hydrolase family 25 protein [Candidatus Aminicenantes bacterium]